MYIVYTGGCCLFNTIDITGTIIHFIHSAVGPLAVW